MGSIFDDDPLDVKLDIQDIYDMSSDEKISLLENDDVDEAVPQDIPRLIRKRQGNENKAQQQRYYNSDSVNGNYESKKARVENLGRTKCRHFFEIGYCTRGGHCLFDHGPAPVVVEDGKFFENNIAYNAQVPIPTNPPPPPPGVEEDYVVVKKIYLEDNSEQLPQNAQEQVEEPTSSKAKQNQSGESILMKTMMELYRRRTEFYLQQANQQKVLLQKAKGSPELKVKKKFLHLVEKNDTLMTVLKKDIESLREEIAELKEQKPNDDDVEIENNNMNPSTQTFMEDDDLSFSEKRDMFLTDSEENDDTVSERTVVNKCRDFQDLGYCVRGDKCVYDHCVTEGMKAPNNASKDVIHHFAYCLLYCGILILCLECFSVPQKLAVLIVKSR
ncbi:cutaneous T-cell lymphoma tumor antigen se70-2 [Ditylenchus destructor]|uniref:Cutaneous T-cell lymphoma tumor antigen se70-2 n=1 Tax=Ditylenchus destructor TaxID=166010 RepID=A0AAD4NN72_9BILA|nr:cutaneous T-cell lymphoma tumor antigen se70-2 [Ditylenchus destructor]